MNAVALNRNGYTRYDDGTWRKRCKFMLKRSTGDCVDSVETLVRSASGRLLRVERTDRALALRAKVR